MECTNWKSGKTVHVSSGVWGVEQLSRCLTDYMNMSELVYHNYERVRLTIMNDSNCGLSLKLIRNRVQVYE